MKIGIDLLPLKTYSSKRGIGKYTFNLVKKIIDIDHMDSFFLYNVPEYILNNFQHEHVRLFERKAEVTDTEILDLFIFTSLFESDDPSPDPTDLKCKKVLVFYDLIPVIFWNHYLSDFPTPELYKYFTRLSLLYQFDIILSISQTTKQDLIEIVEIPPDNIHVIYGGLDEEYLNPRQKITHTEIKTKYSVSKPFVLCTPGSDFRKNISGLIKIFFSVSEHIRNKLQLVVVCNMQESEMKYLKEMWIKLGLCDNQLILTNYIPVEDLIFLYDNAEVFVFPSFYEGFGFPVLEAMARGCPIVTSNVSSLPEVCEGAAVLVNPCKTREFALAIEEILSNNKMRSRLISLGYEQVKKYSWESVASKMLEIIHSGFESSSNSIIFNSTPPETDN